MRFNKETQPRYEGVRRLEIYEEDDEAEGDERQEEHAIYCERRRRTEQSRSSHHPHYKHHNNYHHRKYGVQGETLREDKSSSRHQRTVSKQRENDQRKVERRTTTAQMEEWRIQDLPASQEHEKPKHKPIGFLDMLVRVAKEPKIGRAHV